MYLYHEVSQLFRKETRDFCILQTEHQESSKYIVSLRSVGWPGCEDHENVTRAKVIKNINISLCKEIILLEQVELCWYSIVNVSCFVLQFLASGWIIEPALQDKKVFSMVTYIVQVSELLIFQQIAVSVQSMYILSLFKYFNSFNLMGDISR